MRVKQRWQYVLLALSLAMMLCRDVNADGGDTPSLLAPNGIMRLLDGSLLISDIESHRIFHLDASGHLTFWGGRHSKYTKQIRKINPNAHTFFSLERLLLVYFAYFIGFLPFIPISENSMQMIMLTRDLKEQGEPFGLKAKLL